MYEKTSVKQRALYSWRHIEAFNHCNTCLATGAIRTGKTEIGSLGWYEDAMVMVADTPYAYRTKGYNLFAIISTSKSLAILNIIEPIIVQLEEDGYKECKTSRAFYKSKGGTYTNTTYPMGLLQVKDTKGNITRFLYIGADNKKVLSRVTGLTLRGWFLDEAPLLGGVDEDNIKFIEVMYERTATFRLPVYGGRPLQMMTTNPQDDDESAFYQRFIKNGFEKGILVLSFELLDNPIFTKDDEEYYEKILTEAQYLRKIKGRWVKDNSISTYPKFKKSYAPVGNVITKEQAKSYKYVEMTIGLDEGQSDARSFILTGFTKGYNKVVKIKQYYYKNAPNKPIKDINDYVEDFWSNVNEWFIEFGLPIELKYDSQALYIVEPLKRYKIKHFPHLPVVIKPVNKKRELNKSTGKNSAIKERTDYHNVMFGAGVLEISEECEQLIKAYNKCENRNGERIDDGKTNDVDSLDSSEYGDKHRMKLILDKIMLGGVQRGDRFKKVTGNTIID